VVSGGGVQSVVSGGGVQSVVSGGGVQSVVSGGGSSSTSTGLRNTITMNTLSNPTVNGSQNTTMSFDLTTQNIILSSGGNSVQFTTIDNNDGTFTYSRYGSSPSLAFILGGSGSGTYDSTSVTMMGTTFN